MGAVAMKTFLHALAYWLVESASYAIAILLGIVLKGCV